MPTLRSSLSQLAADFAAEVLRAIRSASLEEILQESGAGPGDGRARAAVQGRAARSAPRGRRTASGRLGRRSAEDIETLVERIAELLAGHPEGLRAEQIREQLNLEAKELPRPLAEALSGGRISKRGQKRATTYFSGGGRRGGAGRPAKKTGKRGGRRGGKVAARGGRPAKKGSRRGGSDAQASGSENS